MKLSKRLQTIADLVEDNTTIIDVGCDHALLDIYLTKKNVKCIATDISQNCINTSLTNIKNANMEDKIELICTDGLNGINLDNVDIVILSGMGTYTVLKILKDKKVSRCIIQTNRNLYELRTHMAKNYIIKNEIVIYEKGRFYNVIEFVNGHKKYSDFELFFGPYILSSDKEYLHYLVQTYRKIIKDKKSIREKLKLLYYLYKIKKYC